MQVNGVWLTGYEARLVTLVNRARVRHGLAKVRVTACAQDVARRWTATMVRNARLYHNPDLRTLWSLRHCGASATWIAENVGVAGADPDVVFRAYMASPGHRANILARRARFIGIGARSASGGRVFDTMNFINGRPASYRLPRVLGEGLTVR